jgi:hypothetical protein
MNKSAVIQQLVSKSGIKNNNFENFFLHQLNLENLKRHKIPTYGNGLYISRNGKNLLHAYKSGAIHKTLKKSKSSLSGKYVAHSYKKHPIKYILFDKGSLQAFAFLHDNLNSVGKHLNTLVAMTPGSGYGSKLLKKVINDARANGKKYIKVEFTTPRIENYYKRFGFKKVPNEKKKLIIDIT